MAALTTTLNGESTEQLHDARDSSRPGDGRGGIGAGNEALRYSALSLLLLGDP